MIPLPPFRLAPQYRDYVWGGDRLRPGHTPTAEAWILYEGDQIADGPLSSQTLAQASETIGEALLGSRALASTGLRFPLLVKLLDCQQWLSVQVHPNDAQAQALEGPGYFGKTEAWHFVDADPQAEILCGFKHAVDPAQMRAALYDGKAILKHVERMQVRSGDTILLNPGTLHALGPGLLVYEVQQTSDLTYRVYDWDRPASTGRKLHLEQSLIVLQSGPGPRPAPLPPSKAGEPALLTRSSYFSLWMLTGPAPVAMDTRLESFHALTLLAGEANIEVGGERVHLSRFETLLVPAASGAYRVNPDEKTRLLAAMVS